LQCGYHCDVAEYDIVCQTCGRVCEPAVGVVSWADDGVRETGFALTHRECVPPEQREVTPLLHLIAPNEFLMFVCERFARPLDAERLRTVVWALAPFVMRPDNAIEMHRMRAATFGKEYGADPFTDEKRDRKAGSPA
jgi:hypothetical protein